MFTRIYSMFDEVHEVVGWIGMLLILLAYAGISLGFITSSTLEYQMMNLIGAAALLYSAAKTKSYPVVALNLAWIGIAIIATSSLF
ncbi:hypothetical protein JXR01_03175 [Candidatus Kaiserbacteria bacterium]|nr:MAG: hypothetical protein JXR01_03175 [Candidatus Kaiserbacteria bacterium]